jgi:hypothetical protein
VVHRSRVEPSRLFPNINQLALVEEAPVTEVESDTTNSICTLSVGDYKKESVSSEIHLHNLQDEHPNCSSGAMSRELTDHSGKKQLLTGVGFGLVVVGAASVVVGGGLVVTTSEVVEVDVELVLVEAVLVLEALEVLAAVALETSLADDACVEEAVEPWIIVSLAVSATLVSLVPVKVVEAVLFLLAVPVTGTVSLAVLVSVATSVELALAIELASLLAEQESSLF